MVKDPIPTVGDMVSCKWSLKDAQTAVPLIGLYFTKNGQHIKKLSRTPISAEISMMLH